MTAAHVLVNGEERPLLNPSLAGVLRAQGIEGETRGVAVAVNGAVVPRRAWRTTTLRPGDEIEVVKLFSGG